MLGKGSLGTIYKAVLDDGYTLAVKRLKDANPCAKNECEQYMDVIGKVKHPNTVKFRAYYYARKEKLLVYDYLPNRSLHCLLHGNRGLGRIPSLVLGTARALDRIHAEYSVAKLPHGSVKSSNIVLNPAHAIARIGEWKEVSSLRFVKILLSLSKIMEKRRLSLLRVRMMRDRNTTFQILVLLSSCASSVLVIVKLRFVLIDALF